ncbi:hypothetical protein LINPERPRIM_LOCUS24533 [Linum perenne]
MSVFIPLTSISPIPILRRPRTSRWCITSMTPPAHFPSPPENLICSSGSLSEDEFADSDVSPPPPFSPFRHDVQDFFGS